jgi:serine protease Do
LRNSKKGEQVIINGNASGNHGRRRSILLSSAGILALALLIGGPGGYSPHTASGWGLAAHAADATTQPVPGFADLVAKVKPAVISVRVKIDEPQRMFEHEEDQGENGNGNIPMEPGSPMERFFHQFGFDQQHDLSRHHQITGEGSGFFISADGYAVTNYHVVDHAKSVQVTTDDGTLYTAKVIGTDQKTDLALIKVDGKSDFPFVKFADHSPRVGDWVVAVGNPFGLGGTVTAGIVSARGRDIGAGPYDDYMQIDAPINKGNSGGPAFDVSGDVVGVNTAIYSPSGGSVGIGFDIPAGTAKMVIAQLKDHGHVTRGWLGVQIQPVTAGIAEGLGLKKAQGAIVDEVQPDSPAAKAGLESGDVVTAVNGIEVKDARELTRKIGVAAPNSAVKLDVLRNGQSKTFDVTLGEMPGDHQAKAENTGSTEEQGFHLGVMLAPANRDNPDAKGVIITAVDPDGVAAQQGLEPGDVILDVNGSAVSRPSQVRQALADAKSQSKHDVLLKVKARKSTVFVAIPLVQG